MLERSIQQLITEGEFRRAADYLDAKPLLSPAERVVRAFLEFHLGEPSAALKQAEAAQSATLDPVSRIQALAVIARSNGRLGAPARAAALLNKAITQAAALNPSLEAELRAYYVQDLLGWYGVEPAVAELPTLREAALRSGNAAALVQFHIAQARVAVLRGPTSDAVLELERAGRLLEEHPHADLSWYLQHVRTGVESMDGSIQDALAYARDCLHRARNANARTRIGYALGNLANILVTTGDFAEARTRLEECLRVMPAPSLARLAVLHTGIHLALLTNDAELATRMIDAGTNSSQGVDAEQSYYRLWFELHRLKWLASRRRYEDVVAGVAAAATPASRLADTELHDRLMLLGAESAFYMLRHEQSAQFFEKACGLRPHVSPAFLVELNRVAAVLSSSCDVVLSTSYINFARRILRSAGLHGLAVEVDGTADALQLSPTQSPATEPTWWTLSAVGLVLSVGRHPLILGHELLELLRLSGVSERCYIVEEKGDRKTNTLLGTDWQADSAETAQMCAVFLGEGRQSKYWLYSVISPGGPRFLWSSIERVVAAARSLQTKAPSASEAVSWFANKVTFEAGMVAATDKSHQLLRTARKLAPSNITVLITGETGTGKELLAKVLHDASPRSEKPFIPFNCSAVSKDMLDAQLFGYRKGAFTGAAEAFHGVIRAAAGGTLFLDEIGEVALDVQPKLLRFLESGEIHPLGEPRPITVDVRVVAATNANLEHLVEEGRFREDLFYRLNVVRLPVPPLRERREEIPPLVQHYLDKWSRESHKTGIRLADETMEYLILFKWPGNVRQLANEMRRMVALAESNAVLMPEHLSPEIAASRRTIPASERSLAPTEFVVRMDQPMSAAMEHLERGMIQYALKLSGGRVEDAAERLGLSRKGLYLKRQRLASREADAQSHSAATA